MNLYFDVTWLLVVGAGAGILVFLGFIVYLILKPRQKTPVETALEEANNNIETQGIMGMDYVDLNLQVIADKYKGYLLKDYRFIDQYDNPRKLDYILILRCGLYAFNVTDYRGVLQGSKDLEDWKVVNGEDETNIPNPILENKDNIEALRNLFNKKAPSFTNMAVIINAYLHEVKYEGIYMINKALDDIYDVALFTRYSPTEIKLFKYELDNILTNHHQK